MCFSAIHWAKIRKIVFGASIEDAKNHGFNELPISNETLKQLGRDNVVIVGGVLNEMCLELFRNWAKREDKKTY